VISAPTQTETYQIPGGGPTHGTDGPLNVAFAIEGTLGDFDEQFLQVARALDPARARAPPDADTNDLSTINVYTVGVLLLSLILTHLVMSSCSLNRSHWLRNGRSSCINLLDALGLVTLIVVLCE
jgi:hypothetical protein